MLAFVHIFKLIVGFASLPHYALTFVLEAQTLAFVVCSSWSQLPRVNASMTIENRKFQK